MKQMLFYLPLLALVFIQCTPKGDPPPQQWIQWTEDLQKRSNAKYAAPTITSHMYFEKIGDVAYVKIEGLYPMFQKQICEDCATVTRTSQKEVTVKTKEGRNITVDFNDTKSISTDGRLLVSPNFYESEDKIRVFLHDMGQMDLAKKRKRKFLPYKKDYLVETQFKWLEKPETVTIQRSDGSAKEMKKVAELSGKLEGKALNLSVYNFSNGESYKQGDATMLLYRDYSNGKKTYGAGRFLNVKFPKKIGDLQNDDKVSVDFNFSYNPPCAFSTGFHCPLPQDLALTSVEVGEAYSK